MGEISQTVSVIAQHCASSALVLAMHPHPGCDAGPARIAGAQEALLPQVGRRRAAAANANSEWASAATAGQASARWSRLRRATDRERGGDRLLRRVRRWRLATARRSPEAFHDQVLASACPGPPARARRGEWDTLGLRGTCADRAPARDIPTRWSSTTTPTSSCARRCPSARCCSAPYGWGWRAGGRQAHAAVRSPGPQEPPGVADAPAAISALRLPS